jgi:hypothetical protein
VVEVDDHGAERPAARAEPLGLLGQPRLERALVEQAGEPVVVRLADELGLAGDLLGAVVDRHELPGVGARSAHGTTVTVARRRCPSPPGRAT